jgi:hypothetical protein
MKIHVFFYPSLLHLQILNVPYFGPCVANKNEGAVLKCGKIRSKTCTVDSLTHFLSFPLLQAKLETKALKAKRPGFTDDRYNETSYYIENGKLTDPVQV